MDPDEPSVLRGLAYAVAYAAFILALNSFAVWGWPWIKAALPTKFWGVF